MCMRACLCLCLIQHQLCFLFPLVLHCSISKHAVQLCLDCSAYYEYQAMPLPTYITACVISIYANKHCARPDF